MKIKEKTLSENRLTGFFYKNIYEEGQAARKQKIHKFPIFERKIGIICRISMSYLHECITL